MRTNGQLKKIKYLQNLILNASMFEEKLLTNTFTNCTTDSFVLLILNSLHILFFLTKIKKNYTSNQSIYMVYKKVFRN